MVCPLKADGFIYYILCYPKGDEMKQLVSSGRPIERQADSAVDAALRSCCDTRPALMNNAAEGRPAGLRGDDPRAGKFKKFYSKGVCFVCFFKRK